MRRKGGRIGHVPCILLEFDRVVELVLLIPCVEKDDADLIIMHSCVQERSEIERSSTEGR